jgi:hypothetical protein
VTNTTSLAPKKQMNDFTFLRRLELIGTGTVSNASTNVTQLTATASQGVTILGMEGKVEIARKGTEQWTPAQTNTVLMPGDLLRTGLRSRATLRWPDNSLVRVNQLTSMAITPPATNKLEKPSLRLNDGTIYQLNKDGTSNSLQISTPMIKARIRG